MPQMYAEQHFLFAEDLKLRVASWACVPLEGPIRGGGGDTCVHTLFAVDVCETEVYTHTRDMTVYVYRQG